MSNIDQVIAAGMNSAALVVLTHLKDAVPVRTGALKQSYRITQQATPQNPTIRIESGLSYSNKFYPLTERFGRTPRLSGKARPVLFGSQPAENRLKNVVEDEIAKTIKREFK